jgi:O-antigen/teichoic acid export membrane protein
MLTELRRIFRLASVYAVGDLFIRGATILLLPLYAAYLTPHEYGILAVATSMAGLASVVFAMGLNGAVVRFYYELSEHERPNFYGTLWLALLVGPALLLIGLELLGGRLLTGLLNQVPYEPYLRLAFLIAWTSVALLTIPLEVFRASERPAAYITLSLGQFAFGAILTVVLVVVLGRGAAGALLARLIAALATGIIGLVILRGYLQSRIYWPNLQRAVAYGLPLLPHFLSHWILTASDRIILERYVPLSEVGVYSIGYQIGSVMILFIAACNNGVFPLFGRLNPRNPPEVAALVRIVTYYVAALAVIGVGIALFAKEIVLVLASRYASSAAIVPWVVLGYMFYALYFPAMNTIMLVEKRTKWVPVFTGTAAAANVVLNLLFIPRFGIVAAAITTAVSYALLFALVFLSAQRMRPLPYEYRRVALILAAGVGVYSLSLLGRAMLPSVSLLVKAGALVAFPVLLWILGFPNEVERHAAALLPVIVYRHVRSLGGHRAV